MKCFYHRADLDGRCSGAIVKLQYPECELIGIDYGEAFPWERISPGETVFMVDFSLTPFSDMLRLRDLCGRNEFVWIDHHKSALAEYAACGQEIEGLQEDGRAGCELTWEYMHLPEAAPRAVYLLGRYDVWQHHDVKGALEFQYDMRNRGDTNPENEALWGPLIHPRNTIEDVENVGAIISDGEFLLKYEEQQNAIYARSCAFEVELDGLRCIAINKGLTNSLLFKSVYDPAKHDAMLSFVYRKGVWKCSIYTDKPEIDASVICKARGGGGHKGAAGFQCDVLPF